LDGAEELELDSRKGEEIFLFCTAPTQPPIQLVPGAVSLAGKRDRGVKLITHLQILPRLGIRQAVLRYLIRLHDVVPN
jgi:hypothetical protein